MKSRAGTSFVPLDHDSKKGSAFYIVDSVISPPNNDIHGEHWVANPNKFNAEAPRTREQCLHVDGSTMGKFISTIICVVLLDDILFVTKL